MAISTTLTQSGGPFPHQRLQLLFNPDTGLSLGIELVALTADTHALGVPVGTPATIGYTLWEDVAFVPDTTTRPRP
ncbi:hypothetical protein [Actinocrispum wychmicini]|uniref:Uncharacterized protein n=1 Tax=Actinocrispum wychmicini TaxID=1213861 RepID=A0A4R2JH34_9PSEU|nr:hypothetical protein [Actinocrispum wychmicini]TCO55689.1 hypothetical protein EV192_107111 [Actinocrispum wychmicini]